MTSLVIKGSETVTETVIQFYEFQFLQYHLTVSVVRTVRTGDVVNIKIKKIKSSRMNL
jgi:hypothetical protein